MPADSENLERAANYARDRLRRDLPEGLTYHGYGHTVEDVVPAVGRLAAAQRLDGEDLHLLLTAAWFHDLGFIETRAGHEAVSIRLATEVLPGLGYSAQQVDTVGRIIAATVLPQTPTNLLGQLLADADLDVLGRDDYFARNVDLRGELAFFGETFTDVEWFSRQLRFLQDHTYFTAAARDLRDAGKARNAQALKDKLAQLGALPG
jgi:uncharacterized protein